MIWRIIKYILISVIAIIAIGVGYMWLFPFGQRADNDFDVSVKTPTYTGNGPIVLFDQAHNNLHTAGGLYQPFARLIENDGYEIKKNKSKFSPETLASSDVLIIVNASGFYNPKFFGINLVPLRKGSREDPAFTPTEIEVVKSWIENGGSLLLIADHYPFGSCAAALSQAFGVTMFQGFAEVPARFAHPKDLGSVIYSRENGLLAEHPISNGRNPGERISKIMSFTGQSLNSPDATAFMILPDSSIEYVPPPPDFQPVPAGKAQGYAFGFGRGRVVIMGEAGMLTAQIAGNDDRFGMNASGIDNKQLALNIMHWLSRIL